MAQVPSMKRMNPLNFTESAIERPFHYFHQSNREDSPEESHTRYFDQSTDEEKFATIVKTKPFQNVLEFDKCFVECPICLSEFHEPKSLPCFHTFCKGCLVTHLQQTPDGREIFIHCPICGVNTQPFSPLTFGQRELDTRFPANSLISFLKRVHRLKENDLTCDPCKKQTKMGTSANVWCKQCGSFLCDLCKSNIHDLIHDNHDVLKLAKFKRMSVAAMSSPLLCVKHNEELKLMCDDHKYLGCATCMTVHHRTCKNVVTSDEFANFLKDTDVRDTVGSKLDIGTQNLDSLIADITNRLRILKNSKEREMKKIDDARSAIDDHLDKIQSQIVDEFTMHYKEETKVLEQYKQKCETLKHSMVCSKQMKEATIVHEDPARYISVFQRSEKEIPVAKSLVKDVLTSHKTLLLKAEINPDILQMVNIKPFGKLSICQEERELPKIDKEWHPLSLCKAEDHLNFSVKHHSDPSVCFVTGVLCLHSGNILCADFRNNKIKMFSSTGEFLDQVILPSRPFDICATEEDKVAVTMPYLKTIISLKVSENSLSEVIGETIKLDRECSGITYAKGRYVVTTGVSSRYQIYNVSKNGQIDVICDRKSPSSYLTFDRRTNDIIFGTQSSDAKGIYIYRISDQREIKCIETGNIIDTGVLGIDVDREGNVYVCGMGSSNVVQIAAHSGRPREIITSFGHNVTSPCALSIYGCKLIISQNGTDVVSVFQLQ